LIAQIGKVEDLATLQAAVLHDTVEDTNTTIEELKQKFGEEVANIVQEVRNLFFLSFQFSFLTDFSPPTRLRTIRICPKMKERANKSLMLLMFPQRQSW
jgi:hypothetical protein